MLSSAILLCTYVIKKIGPDLSFYYLYAGSEENDTKTGLFNLHIVIVCNSMYNRHTYMQVIIATTVKSG